MDQTLRKDSGVSKKRLIVHVGANKTGSSAIQRFLALNAAALRAEGIVVPGQEFQAREKLQGNQVFSFQRLLLDVEGGRERLEDALDSLRNTFPEAGSIVLSAENLAANPASPRLFERLKRDYDLEIVIYIRRQDEFLLSSWQQWHSKASTDFWAWLVSVVGRLGNWQDHLKNWESVIPRDRIKVRVYDRRKLVEGDIVADFHELLNVSTPLKEFASPKNVVNPSFSDAVMDLVKGNELIFENTHDNQFYNFVTELTDDRYLKAPRQSSITMAQRRAILKRYEDQNEWVRANYFPQMSEALFSEPVAGDYEYTSSEDVQRQKLEFLTTLVFQMYKRGSD